MRTATKVIFLTATLFTSTSYCYFESSKTNKPDAVMNGISISKYRNFPLDWKLVTVRYREDSRELRFTYANSLAFKELNSLNPRYPEGAAFGKVSFLLDEDSAFPSSKVPSTSRRYQVMLKNSKKYADSDGWGYALFDAEGRLFNEDIKVKTMSCVACHRIVPERDYVFSRKLNLLVGETLIPEITNQKRDEIIKFKEVAIKDLPKDVSEKVKGFQYIQSLQGSLQKNGFSGTLDEIVPFLVQKSKSSSAPSGLILSEKNFSLVVPLGQKCEGQAGGEKLKIVVVFNSKPVRQNESCL